MKLMRKHSSGSVQNLDYSQHAGHRVFTGMYSFGQEIVKEAVFDLKPAHKVVSFEPTVFLQANQWSHDHRYIVAMVVTPWKFQI